MALINLLADGSHKKLIEFPREATSAIWKFRLSLQTVLCFVSSSVLFYFIAICLSEVQFSDSLYRMQNILKSHLSLQNDSFRRMIMFSLVSLNYTQQNDWTTHVVMPHRKTLIKNGRRKRAALVLWIVFSFSPWLWWERWELGGQAVFAGKEPLEGDEHCEISKNNSICLLAFFAQ